MQRKIIHMDMDAFYAAVEELDFPELKGKPLAVGSPEKRGVICAANYKARAFGVRSAMSGYIAQQKCPELIFTPPRFTRYKEISKKIQAIFLEYTPLVEPLSLDEAYLDVTTNLKNNTSASQLAREIREQIFKETGLHASAGISINKFVAKIASDYNKPNGQKTVTPEKVQDFLHALDIKKFYGIGKVTAQKMYQLGIFKGKDLKDKPLDFLEKHFKNSALHYYQLARGIHHSPVNPNRILKSVGAERTFAKNISSVLFLQEKLQTIALEVENRLKNKKIAGKTITLKIKYSDFNQQTRSKTLPYFICDNTIILETALALLYQEKLQNSVRLVGISITKLNNTETKTPPKKTAIQLKLPL